MFKPNGELYNIDFTQKPKKMKKNFKAPSTVYYNIPVSYDIETSSFDVDGEKQVITYAHALNIDGESFLYRTWDELKEAFEVLHDRANLSGVNHMVVYVHNLAYEFQFMKKHFQFKDVFSIGRDRKVVRATMANVNLEFRCSLTLSGYSLASLAGKIRSVNIKKMTGDLDYSLIRTPETELTEAEIGYIYHDVAIIEHFIREAIEDEDGIHKIPMTKTGYVRNHTRERTIGISDKYKKLVQGLTLEVQEYRALNRAFAGGFTHANAKYSGKTMENVTSKDFASSYPARMVTYMFPTGKGEHVIPKSKDEVKEALRSKCCLLRLTLKGIMRKANEGYISKHKTDKCTGGVFNNGRVDVADEVVMWCTDVDLKCMLMSYEIEDWEVSEMWTYDRQYLPTELIEVIVQLYAAKTELKGVKGSEIEYNKSKEMLNSIYGMSVTDIVQTSYEWNDRIKAHDPLEVDVESVINKNNRNRKRFLYYPWGVWITAYARHDLFSDIVKLGDDYIYSDTDSIYYKNAEDNEWIFESKNEKIKNDLEKAANHHGLDVEVFSPKNPAGVVCTLGVWSPDGEYSRFKTLGAKRYMVEDKKGKVNITVSGVNKNAAVPYLQKTYDDVFEAFNDGLSIPEGHCGKSTHTYIDNDMTGHIIDYMGNGYNYHELSGIHLEETYYTMTIADEYLEFVESLQGIKRSL